MNFAECPVVYIDEYFKEKSGQIDLECEKAILLSNDNKEKSDLNVLRLDLIKQIENARKEVVDRYYKMESKFYQEISQTMIKEKKDEIFKDQYCHIYDVYRKIGVFQFKFGVLIFSQYEDTLLGDLKYFNLSI